MGIGEQFAGLDMANLIGGPLTAAADASILLAQSTADFINKVGFDAEQNARTVAFSFQRMEPDVDGSINRSDMKVEVPLLAIVPIPNLQVDEVNILFDMEVKQCEKSEESKDLGAKFEAGLQIGPVKVSVTGSVSAHSSNTRSSDNSAKYHVDVSATNHGIPEGLSRVLDMMAANVAPTLVSSKAVDETGKELDSGRKQKNQQIRALREKKFQNENALRAANEVYDKKMGDLLAKGNSIEDTERMELARPSETEPTEEQVQAAEALRNDIATSWDNFRANVKTVVTNVCDNALKEDGTLDEEKVGTLAQRMKIKMCAPYQETEDVAESALEALFKDAVNACKDLKLAAKELDNNNVEYNKVMMSKA